MKNPHSQLLGRDLPEFSRDFFGAGESFTCIGQDALGGKAAGLLLIHEELTRRAAAFPRFRVSVPTLTVLCTDLFDAFLDRNDLRTFVQQEQSDHVIAARFQQASLPIELVGDLRALIQRIHQPLAIRSSSLLEDALFEPFAGVYETKMIPNNQFDADIRFRKLADAIKYVWASVFFAGARSYIRATRHRPAEEKMAVIIQEVVGRRHRQRFYPDVAGVARSYNFYPIGNAQPRDGVVSLALGLGKTIVDGGRCWTYSPARPRAMPPYGSVHDLLEQSQTTFWAVNMGEPVGYDPLSEAEYLITGDLADAEEDETLRRIASTYDPDSDRLTPGTAVDGPRALTFAPLLCLDDYPVNNLIRTLLQAGEEALGAPVEIEFALTFPEQPGEPARFGFLQVRAMAVSDQVVELTPQDLSGPDVLVASGMVLGNGVTEGLRDVVYVVPERFEARHTPAIARELERVNRELLNQERPYLLIGFGRWGSSDPWLGIPVTWGQIAGARVMVEAGLPSMNVDFSQGSHFFHNITSFRVSYFSVPHGTVPGIDWSRLAAAPALHETDFVRHVVLPGPLRVRVDGRTRRGVITCSSPEAPFP